MRETRQRRFIPRELDENLGQVHQKWAKTANRRDQGGGDRGRITMKVQQFCLFHLSLIAV